MTATVVMSLQSRADGCNTVLRGTFFFFWQLFNLTPASRQVNNLYYIFSLINTSVFMSTDQIRTGQVSDYCGSKVHLNSRDSHSRFY